jgi:hypothetical protein
VAQHYLTCVYNLILLLNGLTLILTLSCGLWVSVLVTGVPIPAISAGYEPLYGLRASLRATDVSAGDELLYAWLASLSTDYSCGSASTATLTRASTGGWPRSLYRLQLRICQYRKSDARLDGWLASLSLLVADLPVPQPWRDTWRLYGSWTSLSLLTGYGPLNGLRVSRRITGFSVGSGPLRVPGLSAGGWHRSPTRYGCGSASTVILAR